MNIVLLHFGKYDERRPDYELIWNKCYESVKLEFKTDKIYVFHSLEEVFNEFPEIKPKFFSYIDFLNTFGIDENKNYYFTDLIRLLLTNFLDDMLYIDADIYIKKGFRKICKNIIKNIDYFFNGQCFYIFYSKHKHSDINNFIDKIFTVNYKGDIVSLKNSNLQNTNNRYLEKSFYHYSSSNSKVSFIIFIKKPLFKWQLYDIKFNNNLYFAIVTDKGIVYHFSDNVHVVTYIDNSIINVNDYLNGSNLKFITSTYEVDTLEQAESLIDGMLL